jgi:dTDP-4-amino-4,6-dideoxygalactose transaminase
MSKDIKFKEAIASFLSLDSADISLYYKGRVALYSLLKASCIGKGDEVILPAFTCVVVPNAIIYCGATPVYVDIDPLTYNMDIGKVEAAITSKTKVIIAQNTFGKSPNFDGILEIAQKNKLLVFEDCTHGFGGTYKGKKNGTIADATFFSTQWNKPFSTGIGGFSSITDIDLRQKVSKVDELLQKPSTLDQLQLYVLLLVRKYLLKPFLYWPMVHFYRWLSKRNILRGSSSGDELEGSYMPTDYFMGMGWVQAKEGIKAIRHIDELNKRRIQTACLYNAFFEKIGCFSCVVPITDDNIFLKYPLLVSNRKEFLELAEKERIPLGEWFNSPIHPILKDYHKWQYMCGAHPIAEEISARIINLPTDIKEPELEMVFCFLERHMEYFN